MEKYLNMLSFSDLGEMNMGSSEISDIILSIDKTSQEIDKILKEKQKKENNLTDLYNQLAKKLKIFVAEKKSEYSNNIKKDDEEIENKILELKNIKIKKDLNYGLKIRLLDNIKAAIDLQINTEMDVVNALKFYNDLINMDNPYKFNGLIWEPSPPRDGSEKKTFIYNDSMNRLVEAGYQRHPSSAEVFSLIIQYFEDQNTDNKVLTPELTKTVEDMISSTGEWFNQAIETEETKIRIYSNVTSINWDGNNYEKDSMKSIKVDIFDVTGLIIGDYNYFKNIYKKHNGLIKFIYGKKFEKLPEKMQENAGIYIPKPGTVLPVGRNDYNVFYFFNCNGRASLGVSAITELREK